MENTNVTEQSTNEIMPMAASGETNFASLTEKTTPASGDMFLMEDSEDTKKINYDKLADAILNKLTSKTYSGLETTAKNFVTAINELNSKRHSYTINENNKTISFEMTAGKSYLVTCQHSGGNYYYAGITLVDKNKNIKILNINQTSIFTVSAIPDSSNIEISSTLRYWSCDILTISR